MSSFYRKCFEKQFLPEITLQFIQESKLEAVLKLRAICLEMLIIPICLNIHLEFHCGPIWAFSVKFRKLQYSLFDLNKLTH